MDLTDPDLGLVTNRATQSLCVLPSESKSHAILRVKLLIHDACTPEACPSGGKLVSFAETETMVVELQVANASRAVELSAAAATALRETVEQPSVAALALMARAPAIATGKTLNGAPATLYAVDLFTPATPSDVPDWLWLAIEELKQDYFGPGASIAKLATARKEFQALPEPNAITFAAFVRARVADKQFREFQNKQVY